jgi:hypothetical protein
MKKLATLLLFFFASIATAQHKSVAINESINTDTDVKITSISYTVDSIKELKSINWDEIKSIFETNKEDEVIKMSFEINLKESEGKKVKVSGKFSVEGKSENIDDLIKKSKKGIDGLIKIYNKYENK